MPSSSPRSVGQDPSPAPGQPPPRGLPVALLLLALAGLAIAADLWVIHARAHAGGAPSFCDFSERVSCDKVALSPYSALLGVPLAAWGVLAYLTMAGLALSALLRRPRTTWPAGLSLLVAAAMSALALVLAWVSEALIHSLCVMCLGSWIASFGMLGVAWAMARRAGGPGAALRADVAALRARPGLPAAAAGLLAFAAVGLVAWHAAAGPAVAAPEAVPPVGPPGSVVIYEFSDYLCPSCAMRHGELKAFLPSRPDVRLVRRFYPLDDACNRTINREFHKGSCQLALAGVCAEQQGRFEAYDDVAFANQQENLALEDVIRQAGLDLAATQACMADPRTLARVKSDIEQGIAAGVHATPSYQVFGKLYSGTLPPILSGASKR